MSDNETVYVELPAGVLKFGWISKPDPGGTLPDGRRIEGGKFTAKVGYADDSELKPTLDKILQAAIGAGLKTYWDADGQRCSEKNATRVEPVTSLKQLHLGFKRLPDGEVEVDSKSKFQPKVVDSKGNDLVGDEIRIMPGDEIIVGGTLYPYEGSPLTSWKPGVSIQLCDVQKKTGGNGNRPSRFAGRNLEGDAEPVVIHDDTPPPQAVPSVPAPADDDSDIPF